MTVVFAVPTLIFAQEAQEVVTDTEAVVVEEQLQIVVEMPSEVCTDGIDNDGDTLVDLSDPDCLSEIPAPTEVCTDGIDNDGDTLVDLSDPDCLSEIPVENEPEQSSGGRISSGSMSGSSTRLPAGEVLGAFTGEDRTCNTYLNSYLKYGQDNDVFEVLKLQAFLKLFIGLDLELTGKFNLATFEAVKQLQTMEEEAILDPWGPELQPTGYVYKTTKYFINNYLCEGSEVFPNLY